MDYSTVGAELHVLIQHHITFSACGCVLVLPVILLGPKHGAFCRCSRVAAVITMSQAVEVTRAVKYEVAHAVSAGHLFNAEFAD